MLFSLSQQPPYTIYHRKQTIITIRNNTNEPILFRFLNDQLVRFTPTYGMIAPQDNKKVSITNKTAQQDLNVTLDSIVYQEQYLDMLEYQNPLLWREKVPGKLQTQQQIISLIVNQDASTQQSDHKIQQLLIDQFNADIVLQQQQQEIPRIEIKQFDNQSNSIETQSVQQQQMKQQVTFNQISINSKNNSNLNNNGDYRQFQNSQTSNIFSNAPVSPILPQEVSRLSGNQSRITNEQKQQIQFTEIQDNYGIDNELSYEANDIQYQISGNFKDELNSQQSQTSIIRNQQQELIQLQYKENQLKKQIEQLKQNKELQIKELEQLRFQGMFKNKDAKQQQGQQIVIGHLVIVSVICLILGAFLKKILKFL